MKAKGLWFALVFSTWAATAQETRDLRVVNGVAVDLGPVHKWLADHQGERPLKHWKQLRVTEIKTPISGWERCRVKNEAGGEVELLVANLPAQVKTFFQSLNQQYADIVRLRTRIETETRTIRLLDGQIPEAAWGDTAYVNSVISQRRQLEAAKANLETSREQLVTLQTSYDEQVGQAGERLTVLAMFSGRKYSGLEVWDCGKPK